MNRSRKAAPAVMSLVGLAILGYVVYSVIYVATVPGHRLEPSHTILDVAVGISFLIRAALSSRKAARRGIRHDGLTVRHSAQQFRNH